MHNVSFYYQFLVPLKNWKWLLMIGFFFWKPRWNALSKVCSKHFKIGKNWNCALRSSLHIILIIYQSLFVIRSMYLWFLTPQSRYNREFFKVLMFLHSNPKTWGLTYFYQKDYSTESRFYYLLCPWKYETTTLKTRIL